MPNDYGEMPKMSEVLEYYLGDAKDLCPFHSDKTPGSFKYDDNRNIFTCFSCGATGNQSSFIAEFLNISKYEAYKILESDFHYQPDNAEKKSAYNLDLETEIRPLNYDMLNFVYEEFSKCSLLVDEPILTREAENYLKKERGETDLSDYFSFPSRKAVNAFFQRMDDFGIDVQKGKNSENFYVPGFYYDINKRKWACNDSKGICIKIKDEFYRTIAIQIRSLAEKAKTRYFYFSSKKNVSLDYANGCSPGVPIEVIFPKENRKSYSIAVTEGHFKAKRFAALGYIAISVPGVSSYHKVANKCLELIKDYDIDEVFLGFDADMDKNIQVAMCAAYVAKTVINSGTKSTVLHWNSTTNNMKTKGFDDLLDVIGVSNLKQYVKLLDGKQFYRNFFKMYDRLKSLEKSANEASRAKKDNSIYIAEIERNLNLLF